MLYPSQTVIPVIYTFLTHNQMRAHLSPHQANECPEKGDCGPS